MQSALGMNARPHRYTLEGVGTTLVSALDRTAATFVAPRSYDRARARMLMRFLVEGLSGYALGTVLRESFVGAQHWGATDVRAARQQRWPSGTGQVATLPGHMACLADEDLVGELSARLRERFTRIPADVRAFVDRAAGLERTVMVNPDLCLLELCITDELAFGWSVFKAALLGQPLPSVAGRSPASRALWHTWMVQVGVVPALRARADAERSGNIMRIGDRDAIVR